MLIIKLLTDGGYPTVAKCVGKQFYAKRTVTGSGVEVDMQALNAEGGTLSKDDMHFCKGLLFFTNQFTGDPEFEVISE